MTADPRDVKRLGERVKRRQQEMAQDAARVDDNAERRKVIDASPPETLLDFWCDECKRDFEAIAHKYVNWVLNIDTGRHEAPSVWRAWYEAKCPEDHLCRRRITDKASDPYFHQSYNVRRQQLEFADAMLTPADDRFKTVYPERWKEIEAERERRRAHDEALLKTHER